MSSQPQVSVPSFIDLRNQLVQHLQSLVDYPARELVKAEDKLLGALAMLNGLPLTTDEFGLAANRLKNAHRYFVAEEPGAARYELRLILSSLTNGENDVPSRRRFRRR